MRKFLLFTVGFCLAYYAKAQSLSPCGTDKTLEVIENKGDNLFTCRGLPSSDKAVWFLQTPSNPTGQTLGECDSDLTCFSTFTSAFKLDRPSDTVSTVTVNATNSQFYTSFQGSSVLCRSNSQTNDPGDTCQLDLVAVTKSCNVRYNTGTSTSWTVTANCSVTGVFSYLNRYKCRLVQTSPSQQDVGSEVTYTPTGGSGSCKVTGPFPSTTGSHSYQMVIVPGRVNVTANFEGGSSSFQIKELSKQADSGKLGIGERIGIGFAICLVIVGLVITAVICLWRRQQGFPCKDMDGVYEIPLQQPSSAAASQERTIASA